jgi:hypothetical protein
MNVGLACVHVDYGKVPVVGRVPVVAVFDHEYEVHLYAFATLLYTGYERSFFGANT